MLHRPMSAYRIGWATMTALLAAAGMVASALSSATRLVVEFTTFAVIGALAVLAASQTDGPRRHRHMARRALVGASVGGSSVAGLLGLTGILGPASLLLALAVAVASPWAVRTLGSRLRSMSRPSADQFDVVVRSLACGAAGFMPVGPVSPQLPETDEELCEHWCANYRAMSVTRSSRKLMRLAEERGRQLDEMERRNPAGFAAWLASGATAADNPLPYLSLAHIEDAAIDWDEFIEGQGP